MKFLSILIATTFLAVVPAKAAFLLHDVGLIGLMSHDIFAWDHKKEVNTENGRLDLSTIFDYDGGSRWQKGGNPKNEENAPVYTVTMELVSFYKDRLQATRNKDTARKETVAHFHDLLRMSYERAFEVPFPNEAIDAIPNNHEQAALRSMHDILPGRVKLYDRFGRNELVLTNFLTAKTMLNEKELNQSLKPFDGDYDAEYKAIRIPMSKVVLNLKEIDGKFIEKFSPYKQAEMLAELKSIGEGKKEFKDLSYGHEIVSMFSKALCSKGNQWMPLDIPCK